MALFKNYKLGQMGVNVDASPAHLSAEELLKSQNAIRDPLGVLGGLKNRPGLVKFTSALAGSALGGISVPAITPIDTRTLYIAQQTGAAAENWYSSSDLFATSAIVSALGNWQDPTAYYANAAQVSHMGAFFDAQLYYAGSSYTPGTTAPPIRVYNGADDRQISQLPETTLGVTSMVVSKSGLFILALTSGTTDADFIGHVYSMDKDGRLTQIGDAIATGHVPMSLVVMNGLIFVGTGRLTTTSEARVYRINPIDETTWTLDHTFDADDYLITALESFEGRLYAATKNGGGATKGKIVQRGTDGVWVVVDSTINNTGSYEGLTVFNNQLYASSRNYDATTNTAVIRRTSDGSTWATVYNATATTGVGLLNVLGLRIFSQGGTGILHSLNGTSYTAAAPAGGGNCDGALGVLAQSGAAIWQVPFATPSTQVIPSIVNIAGNVVVGADIIQVATVVLTDAQMRALNTVPITILAAQGAGTVIVPLRIACIYEITGNFSSTSTLNVRFDGGNTDLLTTDITMNQNITSRRLGVAAGATALSNANLDTFDGVVPENLAVKVVGSAALTGGTSAAGFRVYMWYHLVTIPS